MTELAQKGRIAGIIKGTLDDILLDREDKIILRLIRGYQDQSLTTEQIWGAIGELTALRHLASSLDSDMTRGLEELEKAHGS